jgi:hypothetical protein
VSGERSKDWYPLVDQGGESLSTPVLDILARNGTFKPAADAPDQVQLVQYGPADPALHMK